MKGSATTMKPEGDKSWGAVFCWLIGGVAFVSCAHLVIWGRWANVPVATPVLDPAFKSVWNSATPVARIINLLTLSALYYAAYVVCALRDTRTKDWEVVTHIAVWTVGPPLYFGLEWMWLFPEWGALEHRDLAVESLKSGREIAKDFWAGFAVLFLALYTERKGRRA